LLSALLATLASTLTALTALLLAWPFVGIVHGYSLCCPPTITSSLRTSSCAAWGSSRAWDFSTGGMRQSTCRRSVVRRAADGCAGSDSP
jgi:hypothetical protein